MSDSINKILDMPIREVLGNSNLSGEEMLSVVESLNDLKRVLDNNNDKFKTFNRTTAAKYLRISDSSFRNKVLEGLIPEGVKVIGQGKVWYKKDLDDYLNYADKKKS